MVSKRVEKALKKEKLREERRKYTPCEVEKVDKQPLLVIIQVFPQIVNITGILESSNEVVVQRSIDNDSLKLEKYLKVLKKKYDLKLFHAQNISMDEMDGYLKQQGFEEVNPNAGAVDIGSKEHWVCVPPNRTKDNVRKFGTFTNDLHAIAQFFEDCKVTSVALESTGVYWIPLFQILEAKGFKVNLVNTKHMKRVPGRTKTDRIDCQWLQKLHSFGLLAASFRPDDQICKIRSLIRHRKSLIEANSKNINHMLKALEQMNVKLSIVVKDICGVSGLRIIQAILDGRRDFEKIAELADPRVKAPKSDIIKALQGDYRSEHLFALKQSLDLFYIMLEKIEECDQQIEMLWQDMCRKDSSEQLTFDFVSEDLPMGKEKKKRGRNALPYDACAYFQQLVGVDLSKIPGISDSLAQSILAEVGLDMTKWPTEHHFASWLGLSPNKEASGTSLNRERTRKVKNNASIAFRQAAATLKSSKSYLGAFYRRIKARKGPAKAITATAHKIAAIFYKMIKQGVEYVELGEDYYIKEYRQRVRLKLERQARLLGYELVPKLV